MEPILLLPENLAGAGEAGLAAVQYGDATFLYRIGKGE